MPPSGGNTKYVVAGLALLVGAIVVVMALSDQAEAPPAAQFDVPTKPEVVERVDPLAQPDLILADEELPAEEELAEQEEAAAPEPEPQVVPRHRDRWDCMGDLDVPALRDVIRQHRPKVRVCYERRLKVNNLLQGDVSLKVKVGSEGQVLLTSASGSLRDREVTSCMERQIRSWNFPSPTNGNCAVVEMPFHFSPKN